MKVMPYRRASSLCLCVHLVGLNPGCARTCDTLSYSLRVNLQLPGTHTNSSLWKCFIFKTPSFWSSWSHYDNEYFAKKNMVLKNPIKLVLWLCQFSLTSLVCSLRGLCSYDQYKCGTPLPLMSPGLNMAVCLKMSYFFKTDVTNETFSKIKQTFLLSFKMYHGMF